MIDTSSPPLILHLSSDYLDPIRPPPLTEAVCRLVDRLTDHPQIVISLQRQSDPRRVFWRDFGTVEGRRLIVHGYFAPPLGVGMLACQMMVARRIGRFLAAEGLSPAVVHSHRFTFEGIAAWRVARATGAAFLSSVRGEVEQKVMRAKPTYRPLFRRMARDAARIYYVSAWYKPRFERLTGADPAKTRLLPNIVRNTRDRIVPAGPAPRIVSAVTLRDIDRKGLPELLRAFSAAGSALDGVTLEIIGEGPPEAQARVQAMIAQNGLDGRAVLLPPMPNEALIERFRHSLALAMPSHNETFGMVYPEALFAGTPILYSKGTGIDGYLDGLPVGFGVRPGDVAAITEGLVRLVRENARLRAGIAESAPALFDRFDPERVLSRYRADVAER